MRECMSCLSAECTAGHCAKDEHQGRFPAANPYRCFNSRTWHLATTQVQASRVVHVHLDALSVYTLSALPGILLNPFLQKAAMIKAALDATNAGAQAEEVTSKPAPHMRCQSLRADRRHRAR